MGKSKNPPKDLKRILESARRLGVELDKEEALQWLSALAANDGQENVVHDSRTGVFGHKVSMLDFSLDELEHFRKIGQLVEFADQPGRVETALALSGSAAQSKIQTFPGDCDYFERINILAPTRAEACRTLAEIMHAKVVDSMKGTTFQLIEVKFGSYPADTVKNGQLNRKGTPISWTASEVVAGQFDGFTPDGQIIVVVWNVVADEPGWCKLDWVIADPVHGSLANASNMLDVTWEAPDGSITPLDGYLDPYFQEIYLEASSVPIFSKLAQHVSANALDEYVSQLEGEVNKYLTKHVNYGKAAKRMYNIFRLTGRYGEASFIRELFDEPASMLYQVWSLIRTIEDCCNPTSPITSDQMLTQTDQLILSVISALEGEQETEIVRLLLRMRETLSRQKTNQELNAEAEAARAEVINVVNNFFYEKLTAVPEIKLYMDGFQVGK
ncbi:MAG: hypothetical protein A2X25_09125 [Chloroflexi bacterium GWB2_49_20]|nr:MAG: hypothetical protein A2X25_09125 [Chloroflexi bacterium GWB2_49_20]OGN79408.1 MAG: hypothetical protein A2X26_04900 [Chloroflexi bacterium GWC2_49_37]OGN82823.1 MAG: hypothetical protein A2X27_07795 [Chloroflexi bacterium GWD2_49_16]HCC79723.1 hypothetical protein [Anaerolineae bacterium]HCM97295.1 hypothetical protein [Anaerolineae bacterium]